MRDRNSASVRAALVDGLIEREVSGVVAGGAVAVGVGSAATRRSRCCWAQVPLSGAERAITRANSEIPALKSWRKSFLKLISKKTTLNFISTLLQRGDDGV